MNASSCCEVVVGDVSANPTRESLTVRRPVCIRESLIRQSITSSTSNACHFVPSYWIARVSHDVAVIGRDNDHGVILVSQEPSEVNGACEFDSFIGLLASSVRVMRMVDSSALYDQQKPVFTLLEHVYGLFCHVSKQWLLSTQVQLENVISIETMVVLEKAEEVVGALDVRFIQLLFKNMKYVKILDVKEVLPAYARHIEHFLPFHAPEATRRSNLYRQFCNLRFPPHQSLSCCGTHDDHNRE